MAVSDRRLLEAGHYGHSTLKIFDTLSVIRFPLIL